MEKPVILAVDDEPEVLRALVRDLRKQYGSEYRILRASSGKEAMGALVELRTRREPVALVLSDQRMPGQEGVDLLAQARQIAPDARRALLTAYADTNAAIRAINESQLDHYLLKPWDPPEERLFPVLDDLLEDWRGGFRPGYGGLRVIGYRWSPESHALRDFLGRNQIPYRFLDLETSDEAQAQLAANPQLAGRLPLVELPGGEILPAPDTAALAARVGMRTAAQAPFYDLAIVGAGPAGLAAAVYGASEGLKTVLVESTAPGGQAGTSSRIENYLGFPSGLSGSELARRAVAQASRFGVEILTPARAVGLTVDGPYRRLKLEDGSELAAHVVLLSTGVSWRPFEARGADRLAGRGVYYGAAMTEAAACRDAEVYIVGAGNSAGQAAIHLAEHARRVVMLVRGSSLASRMSSYLVERIEAHPRIAVRTRTQVAECHGEEALEALTLMDCATGHSEQVATRLLFILVGAVPHTGWLDGTVARDEHGFLLTGPDLAPEQLTGWLLPRAPFTLECNVPGVFAAGDVRANSIKRVASAVGEGSVCVHYVHRHLAER